MKILIFTQYFWPENFIINDLAVNLSKSYKIEVLTGKPNYPQGNFYNGYGFFKKNKEIFQNILIHRVPMIPRYKATKLNLFINIFSFIFFTFFRLIKIKLFSKYQYYFLYATSPLVSLISIFFLRKNKNSKIILWLQDLWPKVFNNKTKFKFLKIIVFIMCKYIYKKTDIIFVQNKNYKEYLIKEMKINEDKIYLLHNWSPIELDFNYNTDHNQINKIIYTGNIGNSQNFENVVEAFKSIKNIQLDIYGEGKFKNKLIKIIKENNITNINLYSAVEVKEISRLIKNYDAALISLDAQYSHTIPGKFQFYLSMSMPIIAAIKGETMHIINKNNVGLCSEPNNSRDLRNKIISFCNLTDKNKKSMAYNSFNLYKKIFAKEININILKENFEKFK